MSQFFRPFVYKVKGVSTSDKDILESLYRRYYAGALLYMSGLCGDLSLAEDIVSEAFVKAFVSLPKDSPSFKFWLYRVCRNLWLDHLRRQKRHCSDEALEFIPAEEMPESLLLKDERRKALWAAIGKLKPQDRELIILHYFSSLSIMEAAKCLHISYSAARKRICRLREILRKELEEQGYGL